MTKKSRERLKYLENEKGFQDKKHFSSGIKGFQLSKIVSDLRERLQVLRTMHNEESFVK